MPTHAGGGDRHVGHSKRTRKFCPNRRQLVLLASSLQALGKSMQRPDIVRMLGAALNLSSQT
jgi:hypothetical protein